MECMWRCFTIPCRCYLQWREKKKQKCIVRTYNPKMRIRGKVEVTNSHFQSDTSYIAFRNIPYALPPVGRRRFEPPQELREVPFYQRTPLIKADKDLEIFCIQYFDEEECWEGDEDCLYLNIFTPRKPKDIETPLPVLVYIHGGGFYSGGKDSIEPPYIVSQELVLVTVNYRLGLFGFLNMRSPNCRGNAGMKDQVMALRWIKKNIAQFEGDPENVTICGQSAGGSSVNFHMISPLSKGLFHKAIVMAGGVYCPWGYGGHGREMKQLFKNMINMENELRHLVVETLKCVDVEDLITVYVNLNNEKLKMEPKRLLVFLSPTVECVSDESAFLPDTVEKLMEKAEPVPTIAGITKQEGYMFFRDNEKKTTYSAEWIKCDTEFTEFLQQNFRWNEASAPEHLEKLRSKYFPNIGNMSDADIKEHLATMATDLLFRRFYDNFKIGNLMKSRGPSFYVYEFDYFAGEPIEESKTITSINGDKEPVIVPRAAEHGDDMVFLYCPYKLESFLNRIHRKKVAKVRKKMSHVISNMSNLWGSFCKCGNPRCQGGDGVEFEWKRCTEEDPCYLHIDEELIMREGRLKNTRWSELNAICESVSVVPSLASTPQTPEQVIEPAEESMVEWFKKEYSIP